MAFIEYTSFVNPTVARPISLRRANIDPATLVLTLHYREWISNEQRWVWEPRQQVLELHKHYRLDVRRGTIELLADPFWVQVGLWAAGDRVELLLYKGQVKHDRGQRIDFTYEYFAPEEVDDPSTVDLEELDPVASARLGYDVLKYSPMAKEAPVPANPWNWEKKAAELE